MGTSDRSRLSSARVSRVRRASLIWACCLASVLLGAASPPGAGGPDEGVTFGRDVRPILSDRCFQCHGPDAGKRQAELRLDTFEFATQPRDGYAAIVPGDSGRSELYLRITNADPDELMPPAHANRKPLSSAECAIFKRWIDQGARYEDHWAFVPPRRPELPDEGRNPIDVFVQARLAREGLTPSAPVAPEIALRRLFLDLTGLPPTPEEIDAFLLERSLEDHQVVWLRWIQKIFKQDPYRTRYAERMASPWLDQARYADTSGIHMDAGRQIWPWRDWVLRSYRDNMPFDRFLTEQIAGDLLPDAGIDQKVASGFNRNHITTDEGGAIDAEYLVEYAADRVATTSSVFLGLSMGCARCHDHKFDPLTQKDYYSMFSFFASNEEPGLYSQRPDPKRAFEPFMEVPNAEQSALRSELAEDLASERGTLDQPSPAEREALNAFRTELPRRIGLVRAKAEVQQVDSRGGATLTVTPQGTVLASGENPATDVQRFHLRTDARDLRLIQLDVLGHESFTKGAPGRAENGNGVLTGLKLEAVSVRDPQKRDELKVIWLWADGAQDNEDWSLPRALDPRPNSGWAIAGHEEGTERVALFLTEEPFGFRGGTEVIVTLEYESIYGQHSFGHIRLGLAGLSQAGVHELPLTQGHWYHAGPFALGDPATAYSRELGPELQAELDLSASFDDADGKSVSWVYKKDFVDDKVTSLPGGVNIHYLAREIYAPETRTVEISLGSDDGFVVYVNGQQAAERQVGRAVAAAQDRATIELREGRNTLVLKVINTGGAAGFYYKALESAERFSQDLVAVLVEKSARADGGAGLMERVTHGWRLSRSPEYVKALAKIAELEQSQKQLEAEIPRTMVMKERETPRSIFVLERGEYDKADESRPVTPAIPALFGSLFSEEPGEDGEPRRATRVDLANWMTSRENPLVARVAVNRLWQLIFGNGLVSTSSDFGYQGSWPSHPEMLDWLAVEFIESGWDVQDLLTLMLSSQTYLQSSHMRAEVLEADPRNHLLAHFPRRRLDAERVRDQALYVAGLLSESFGGPSVKPYQPEGLWREVAMPQSNTRIFQVGNGEDLWRRSLYTYWKRACPPPAMMTFDAPTREACLTQRPTTNTPLQALVLWNDEQFMEAARVLAERTLAAQGETEDGIREMFRRCTGRLPSARELELLGDALEDHLRRYRASPEDALALVTVGEHERKMGIDEAELAAWTLLASALLNLHATITVG